MYNKNSDIGFEINWEKLPDSDRVKQVVTRLYDLRNQQPLTHHVMINGLPIFFDPSKKVIGLNFSGGADSTLLFFLLCKLIEVLDTGTKIVASTLIRFWEDRSWTDDLATNIFGYMRQRFPKIEMTHEIGFVPTALERTPVKNLVFEQNKPAPFSDRIMQSANADVYAVKDYSKYLAAKHGIAHIYGGTTMNPGHLNDTVKAPKFRANRDIDISDMELYMLNSPAQDPFSLVHKNWVMAQYDNFELEDLLSMTRSCEINSTELDRIYGKGQWHITGSDYSCGTCFFCHERKWGYDNRQIYLKEYHSDTN